MFAVFLQFLFGVDSKREKNCKLKAVLISVVERHIEEIYDAHSLAPEIRGKLEEHLQSIITDEQNKFTTELSGLQKEKEKLEHKRKKLLEAHYSDAIPLELLKSEQAEISKKLAVIEHDIEMRNTSYEEIHRNLLLALDLIEDCGQTYRQADDATKRLLNQAIFKGFYIYNENTIKAELAEPFNLILPAVKDDIIKINRAKAASSGQLADIIENAKRHIQSFFGCGAFDSNNESPYPNESNFFGLKSLSKDFLVDDTRLELVTSRTSSGCATSCANRPYLIYQQNVFYQNTAWMSILFYIFIIVQAGMYAAGRTSA